MTNRLKMVERDLGAPRKRVAKEKSHPTMASRGGVFAFARTISARAAKPWPRVQHDENGTAWAGRLAFMINWKQRSNEDVETVMEQIGDPWFSKFRSGGGPGSKEMVALLEKTQLVSRPMSKKSPESWEELLLKYGPLWVPGIPRKGKSGAKGQGVVVVGLKGGGTSSTMKVEIADTSTGKGRRIPFDRFLKGVSKVTVVHWPADARLSTKALPASFEDDDFPASFDRSYEEPVYGFAGGAQKITVPEEPNDQDWYSDEDLDVTDATESQAYIPELATAAGLTRKDAKWAEDAYSPDYRHLETPGVSKAFSFTANHLRELCRLNSYSVDGGQDEVLFGLRGCMLPNGNVTNFSPSVILSEDVPDHYDYHCVIGVWKRSTNQLAAFKASTVPNWRYMEKQQSSGSGHVANMLPTGRYVYIVGDHRAVPGAFLLRGTVVVIRSNDDLIYETSDDFERWAPGDNIHPGFKDPGAKFSSAGCQTISGYWDKNAKQHKGDWAVFRTRAGLTSNFSAEDGRKYLYVLFTGRDARLLTEPGASTQLKRLRFGSKGPNVEALQMGLEKEGLYNAKVDGDFGPGTSWAYVRWQRKTQKQTSDGIVTPDSARSFNFDLIKNQSIAHSLGIQYASGQDRYSYYLQNKTSTFSVDDINRMKKFFIKNATSASPKSCIGTLNQGMKLLLNKPDLKVGSKIQSTMEKMKDQGHATKRTDIEFLDSNGKITKGVRRPEKLSASVLDTMLSMAKNEKGWSVFGLSIMDGYHSVTLTLDNTDPANPKVYWSDQWSSKGGWKQYTKAELDKEITELTQDWWDKQEAGKKHKTRTTLWRILPGNPN